MEKRFSTTNIQSKPSVPENAVISFVGIKSIRPAGIEDVYNMEVKKHHNFLINGGLVAHNCMDDIRYFCNTILKDQINPRQNYSR